jgi:hypothetical protein
VIAALLAILLAVPCPHPHRSRAAVAKFRRVTPCPSTGRTKGACPGYVADHVVPICAGGADDPSNMAWQPVADAKAKDKVEDALCAWIRKLCVKEPGK